MEQYISLIISFLGFAASVYYSNKNSRKQDVESIKKEVERDTKISVKLDNLLSTANNTDREIAEMRKDLNRLSTDYITIARDVENIHEQQELTDSRLSKLHQEYREHMSAYHRSTNSSNK